MGGKLQLVVVNRAQNKRKYSLRPSYVDRYSCNLGVLFFFFLTSITLFPSFSVSLSHYRKSILHTIYFLKNILSIQYHLVKKWAG